AVQGGLQPTGGVLLAPPGHGGVVDFQRGGDRPVGPAGPASPWLALSRMRAWVRARAGAIPWPISVCSRARSSSDKTTTCCLRMLGLLQPPESRSQQHGRTPHTTHITPDEVLVRRGASQPPAVFPVTRADPLRSALRPCPHPHLTSVQRRLPLLRRARRRVPGGRVGAVARA